MTSSKTQCAQTAFARGCNCAQSVLSTFAPALGLSPDLAMRLACGFGAGMRQGETCGALVGAIMVLGLRHGNTSRDDLQAKERTYLLVPQLMEGFRKQHGTVTCRDLLGCDMSTDRGRAEANALGLFERRCPHYVQTAVELLEQMTPQFSVTDL